MTGRPIPIAFPSTGSAVTLAQCIAVSVIFVVRVSLRTMRFGSPPSSIYLRCQSPTNILRVSDGLQMIGVHTVSNAAKVIEFKAGRNRADEQFVSKTMGLPGSPVAQTKHTVTEAMETTRPQPTFARPINFRPETFLRSAFNKSGGQGGQRIAVFLQPLVMHGTQPACDDRPLTFRDGTGRLSAHRILQWFGVMGPDVHASWPLHFITVRPWPGVK